MEINKTKKREKIVIHYEDGTTEDYTVGVLFGLKTVVNEEGEEVPKIVGQFCNTRHCIKEFNYALAQIIISMLEKEDNIHEFYNE